MKKQTAKKSLNVGSYLKLEKNGLAKIKGGMLHDTALSVIRKLG